MQDAVIELLSSDDESIISVSIESETERCSEEKDGFRSKEVHDLIMYASDTDDS
jgi:hypothetical protein